MGRGEEGEHTCDDRWREVCFFQRQFRVELDDKTVILLSEEICFSFSRLRRVEGSYQACNDDNAAMLVLTEICSSSK